MFTSSKTKHLSYDWQILNLLWFKFFATTKLIFLQRPETFFWLSNLFILVRGFIEFYKFCKCSNFQFLFLSECRHSRLFAVIRFLKSIKPFKYKNKDLNFNKLYIYKKNWIFFLIKKQWNRIESLGYWYLNRHKKIIVIKALIFIIYSFVFHLSITSEISRKYSRWSTFLTVRKVRF